MPLTRRARRRLTLMSLLLVVFGCAVSGVWWLRQIQKDAAATEAREADLALFEKGAWAESLPQLALAVSRDNDDLEALVRLADARSRVPEVNDRHISTASSYYTRAVEACVRDGRTDEIYEQALLGQARMARFTGAPLTAERACTALLGIDPENEEAVEILIGLKAATGELLPEDDELLFRNGRSLAAWGEALREADDRSALRWHLAQIEQDGPSRIISQGALFTMLKQAGWEDRQRLRSAMSTGRLVETPRELAQAIVELDGPSDDGLRIIHANECLADDDPDAARLVLGEIDPETIEDPEALLLLLGMRERLDEVEDRRAAAAILDQVVELSKTDPGVAVRLGLRQWFEGNFPQASTAFRNILEAEEATATQLLTGALVAAIQGLESQAEWIDALEVMLAENRLEASVTGVIRPGIDFIELAGRQGMTPEQLEEIEGLASTLPANLFIQLILGDVYNRTGLVETAIRHYEDAARMARPDAVPVQRRLIEAYLDSGASQLAFERAFAFASVSRQLLGEILLLRSYIGLESSGLSAQLVESSFSEWPTSFDFAQAILDGVGEREGLAQIFIPLSAEAAISSGRLEELDPLVDRLLAMDAAAATHLGMARVVLGAGSERVRDLLDAAIEADETGNLRSQIALVEAAVLEREGRLEEAAALLEKQDDPSGRSSGAALARARVERALRGDADLLDAIEGLDASGDPFGPNLLARLQLRATQLDDEDLSLAMITRMTEELGERSPWTVLLLARHTLQFSSDDESALDLAVVTLDPLVTRGDGSAEMGVVLARLLLSGEAPDRSQAVEVLRRCVQRYPARFDAMLLLIDVLQEMGRFEEAEEYLADLWNRRDVVPPSIQVFLASLLESQGNRAEVASLRCEKADRTGDPVDAIACVRALLAIGDVASADARLDLLEDLAERPAAVDLELAARATRRGDVETALGLLRSAGGFDSEVLRETAIASLLLEIGRLEELGDALPALVTRFPESADLQVIAARHAMAMAPADVEAAGRALDAAIELAGDDPSTLGRILAVRMGDPGLRAADEGRATIRVIDAVERVQPIQGRLARIALRAAGEGDRLAPSDRDLTEVIDLIEASPYIRLAWSLGLDLHASAFRDAVTGNDLERSQLLGERLVDLASRAADQFPGDAELGLRLAAIRLQMGDPQQALLVAERTVQRIGEAANLGSAIRVAQLQLFNDQPTRARQTLAPFLDEVREDPATRPLAWSLMVDTFLRIGSIEEAWELFMLRAAAAPPVQRYAGWLSRLENLDAEDVLEAVRFVEARTPPEVDRTPSIGALLVAHQRTADPRIRAEVPERLAREKAKPAPIERQLQLAVFEAGLDDRPPESRATARFLEILESIPEEIISRTRTFPSLPEAERARLAMVFQPVLLSVNNFVANAAGDLIDGRVEDPAELEESLRYWFEFLDSMNPDLPEVTDTLAIASLALGDLPEARRLADEALAAAPGRGTFRYTLARILAAGGEDAEARGQVLEAIRILSGADPLGSERKLEEMRDFLFGLQR
ncbi:MAG: tetratricopeptide repeat protein [Planctomycetota bacterium]|nr:tetratricopeptide repeat protein [Planctomycetota bacterium]